MSFTPISSVVETELLAVNATILRSLESHVEAVEQIGRYLVDSGGKRIRSLVALLSSKACGAKGDGFITMAAIIEFIHTATLLHDDVVDSSKLRRGRLTANQVWDNSSAILVGDFLYSRAFQMMVTLNSMSSMRILAAATNMIAEGEVLQLSHRFEPDINEARYLNVIQLKTAKLFEAAAQLGAVMAGLPLEAENALGRYGMHLGIAFQLVDDVLDYQASSTAWGKSIGNDLAEGKITLPLIYALQRSTPLQAQQIRDAIKAGSVENLNVIQEIIVSTGAIEDTLRKAKNESTLAIQSLEGLPASTYRDAMIKLAEFAVARNS
jgi:octaprenyl-diphosphate synthase